MVSLKMVELNVTKKAHNFCLEIYKTTKSFSQQEIYGLTSQLRRAAVSVSLNIVEGQNRQTRKEFIRYLYQARGSLEETRECLLLSKDLGYLSEDKYQALEENSTEISKMLNGLIKRLKGAFIS